MEIKRLKISQQVWIHNGEFPVIESVDEIDTENNEVWLSDGHPHNPKYIYSSESKCRKAN